MRFYGDPAVMAIRKYGAMAPDVARAQHGKLLAHWAAHGFGLCAVFHEGRFAGECGLRWRDDTPEVELSYGLFPEYRGRGLATEAARAALDWGFGPLKLRQIVAYSRGDNRVSHQVLEKLGMRFRGFTARGQHGVVSYALDAPVTST